ncbi:MAG TPA: hypothetical protein VHR45_04210 [Thermoanaerobaculia bacterium]|nr:hypothetical protein [Thermoanaerobaculia bacterium]
MKNLGFAALAIGLCLASWFVFLLHLLGLTRLPDRLQMSLYAFYGAASALGWVAGMFYVQRTRNLQGPLRRRLFLLFFFAPPGLLFLIRSMAPLAAQRAAPLVPVWALGVFGLFFLVPVSFRSAGKT